jgi:hypothetical protein
MKNSLLKVGFYLLVIIISTGIALIFGEYFRTPNNKLIMLLVEEDSKWQYNLLMDAFQKASPYFSREDFDFNWPFAVLSFLTSLFTNLFLFDTRFRLFLFKKFTFQNERKFT